MQTVIIINNESFGQGDEALGKQLMGAYLRKLWASPVKPETIILYNSGVKLMAKGSTVLEVLQGLEEAGVEVIACGTCIAHYELKEDVLIGRISNMEEIVDLTMKADKVITV